MKNINSVAKKYMKIDFEQSEPFIIESLKIFKELITTNNRKE